MVTFSLVNSKHEGGYLIASDQAAVGCRELPHDLAREIEDVQQHGEKVKEVSIGLDGDWFLRTNMRCAWKTEFGGAETTSNVEFCNQLTKRVAMGPYTIQSFTFVPDSTGYVAVLYNRDGSFTHCAWHNIPPNLAALLSREAPRGVRRVAVGVNGSYVVVLNNGCIWWSNVPESLGQVLDNAQRTGCEVVTVSLSLISPSGYFVELAGGFTEYVLPLDWHASINEYISRPVSNTGAKTFISPNSTSSLSSYSPPHTQYKPFSPIDAHSFHPVYTLFDPNQYTAPVLNTTHQTAPSDTHMYCHAMPPKPQTTSTAWNNDPNYQIFGDIMDTVASAGPGLGVDLGIGFGGF